MKKQDWDPTEQGLPKKERGSKQPDWQFIANLGDEKPLDYGGYFVYRDETGVYEEEAELLVVVDPAVDEESDQRPFYTIYRIILERMKLADGYLVPFAYTEAWPHPVQRYDAWFHGKLAEIAETSGFYGVTKETLELAFSSADPLARADAYRAVADHEGWENFDSYPLTPLTRAQVQKRYSEGIHRGPL